MHYVEKLNFHDVNPNFLKIILKYLNLLIDVRIFLSKFQFFLYLKFWIAFVIKTVFHNMTANIQKYFWSHINWFFSIFCSKRYIKNQILHSPILLLCVVSKNHIKRLEWMKYEATQKRMAFILPASKNTHSMIVAIIWFDIGYKQDVRWQNVLKNELR